MFIKSVQQCIATVSEITPAPCNSFVILQDSELVTPALTLTPEFYHFINLQILFSATSIIIVLNILKPQISHLETRGQNIDPRLKMDNNINSFMMLAHGETSNSHLVNQCVIFSFTFLGCFEGH